MKELDLTGRQLQNYKIVSKLGQGGMATVYKAHESSLNRMVALKVLSPQLSEQGDYIKRFQREAQAAARLNHPGIVQVYAIGEEEGVHFFAMEYIKGQSLAHVQHEEGNLSAGRAVEIIKQVAVALGEAHRVALVHRDIKPANIMIDPTGRAKVTDFGIAYLSHGHTRLTREGSVVGTPEYLSPEQCEGKTVDHRSDIYSLGVTLYQLLTGKTPYEADTPVSMLMKIVKGDFPPLREVNPNVSVELAAVVEKMMATRVEDRYRDMGEVVSELAAWEAGTNGAVVATDIPTSVCEKEGVAEPQAVGGAASGRKAALIVTAVIVLLMGGAFAAKVLLNRPASPPATQETPVAAAVAQPETNPTEGPVKETVEELMAEPVPDPVKESVEEPGEAPVAEPVEKPVEKVVGGTMGSGEPVTSAGTDRAPSSGGSGWSAGGASSGDSSGDSSSSGSSGWSQGGARPAEGTCLITGIGDDGSLELVTPFIRRQLSRNDFTVIDGPTVSGRGIAEVARRHIVVTVSRTGSKALNYYGRTSELVISRLTVKVVDPATGGILVGPESQRVEHTSLNAEEQFKEAIMKLMPRILGPLRSGGN